MREIHPLSSEGRRVARAFRKLELHVKIDRLFQEAGLTATSVEAFVENLLPQAVETWKLNEPLDCWELSIRTSNSLRAGGINTYAQLLEKTERQLLRCPNFGRKSLNEINDELVKRGGKLKEDPGIGAG